MIWYALAFAQMPRGRRVGELRRGTIVGCVVVVMFVACVCGVLHAAQEPMGESRLSMLSPTSGCLTLQFLGAKNPGDAFRRWYCGM